MIPSEILRAAQQKADQALLAYFERDKHIDAEIRERLINDLKKATVEFLEVRRRLFQGRN